MIGWLQEVDYAYKGNGKPKGHAAWRNYDDFNEFFWYTILLLSTQA